MDSLPFSLRRSVSFPYDSQTTLSTQLRKPNLCIPTVLNYDNSVLYVCILEAPIANPNLRFTPVSLLVKFATFEF